MVSPGRTGRLGTIDPALTKIGISSKSTCNDNDEDPSLAPEIILPSNKPIQIPGGIQILNSVNPVVLFEGVTTGATIISSPSRYWEAKAEEFLLGRGLAVSYAPSNVGHS